MEAASISQPSHGAHGSHAGVHDEEHHGPPEANRSSRVEPQLLGMLLFIISEVMVFGAFFTAYFFIRVVGGAEWPAEGTELPKLIAGVNTAILLSSSVSMHWALESAKSDNRFGLQAGILTTLLLGATFLFIQINEYVHVGFAPQDNAQGSIFYGLTGLHGAHVFVGLTLLTFTTVRAFRGHFTPEEHRGVEVPGIYWHFVDVMWVVVYLTIYIICRVINPLRSEAEAFRFLIYVVRGRGRARRARAARSRAVLSAPHLAPWGSSSGSSCSRRSTCARCGCCAGAASPSPHGRSPRGTRRWSCGPWACSARSTRSARTGCRCTCSSTC